MEYKDNLINFDLKSFLENFSEKDIISLKKKYPENYMLLADQIKLYPKANLKLPVFAQNHCFFTSKSYEQASSESLALYKADLFKGETIIDLTGGLGADDWAFSEKFTKVISVDIDAKLNKLARINFTKLGLNNVERIDEAAEEFIKSGNLKADLIYIDADRRSKNKKTVKLEDASPQVLKILSRLTEISKDVLLKLSPLTDITYILKCLNHIAKIYVISLDNDVKEILVHIDKDYQGKVIIEAADISRSRTIQHSSDSALKNNPEILTNGKYFYEPANALIKSGLINDYAFENQLKLISTGGVYLTGDNIIDDFFGRGFKIITSNDFSKSQFKKYLTDNKITKANFSARNFPLTPEEMLKIFKLKDGGENYFFFTQINKKQKMFYHCAKVK